MYEMDIRKEDIRANHSSAKLVVDLYLTASD